MRGVSKRIAGAKISATLLALMMVLSSAVVLTVATENASALPAGLQEFYLPLPADLTRDIFNSIQSGVGKSQMHYVVSIVATSDTTTVYYDHWENGYKDGASGDVTRTLNRGETWILENDVPSSPRGTSTYYDGGDRIFTVGGPVQVVVSTWSVALGTLFADAWEVYPVQAWEGGTNAYVIPVGETIAGNPLKYEDFKKVWIQITSGSDANAITVTSSTGTNLLTTTLARGKAVNLEITGGPGAKVTSTNPVEVQIIAGNPSLRYDMRGYSVLPRADWGTSYYAPAPSWPSANTDIYVFNPSSTAITINYRDRTGSGTFTVGANAVKSYQDGTGRYVPQNSGVHLTSPGAFWALASCDSESADWDWAYSLIPADLLTTETYLGWAPGNQNKNADGSSVYITASVDNTEVRIYHSPDDGVADHIITDLDTLETATYWDPDHDNTGMRIVASAPVAIAWGENPALAGTGAGFLDVGYTVLPISPHWVDIGLAVEKTANPDQIVYGQATTFTINISVPASSWSGVTNIDLVDTLPAGWEYVANSAYIVTPAIPAPGTQMNPTISGSIGTGYILTWDGSWTLSPGQKVTLTFNAKPTSTAAVSSQNRNVATATGTTIVNPTTLTAEDDAFVIVKPSPALGIEKTANTTTAKIGDTVTYTIRVWNDDVSGDGTPIKNVTVSDPMGGGTLTRISGDDGDNILEVGENWTYSFTRVVLSTDPNPIINTANAVGEDLEGSTVGPVYDTATVGLTFAPLIEVNKVANKTTAKVGDKITYTITVKHAPGSDGSDVLNLVMVDSLGGTLVLASGDVNLDGKLNAGETWTYIYERVILVSDPDPLVNTATATGKDRDGNTVTDSDDASVAITFAPLIEVNKVANVQAAKVGDLITYTITVQHASTSDGSAIYNVVVNDSLGGILTVVSKTGGNQDDILEAGEIWTYTYARQVLSTDPDPLINKVTGTGEDRDGDPVGDEDEVSTPIEYNPALLVTKTGPARAKVGETITYTITVQHDPTSDRSNITSVVVSDFFGITPIYQSGDDGDGILEYGEVWTYTVQYTIPANAPNPLINTAIATGVDQDGDEVRDEDDEAVPIEYNPLILVTKTGPGSANVGDEVNYTITVKHAQGSDGSDVYNLTVTDPLGTPIYLSGDDGDGILELGEVWTYYMLYSIPTSSSDPLVNTATAHGTDNDGDDVTDSDDHEIDVEYNPAIMVTKTANVAKAKVGDTIRYDITVQHAPSSDGSNIYNVQVTDVLGITPIYVSGDDGDGILEYGEVWLYTVEYTIPANAPNPLINVVVATGEDGDGDKTTDEGTEEVPIEQQCVHPAICVIKCGPPCAYVGDTVTYTFEVYNTGNVPLSNVGVYDSVAGQAYYVRGDTNGNGLLDVTEVWTFEIQWVVQKCPRELYNIGTATGYYNGKAYTDWDDHCLVAVPRCVPNPSIEIVKSGPATAQVCEEITYIFTVTNTGNVALSDVRVFDDVTCEAVYVSGDVNCNCLLDVGEVWIFTARWVVHQCPDPLINTATVIACYGSQAVTDCDTHCLDVVECPPEIVEEEQGDGCTGQPNGHADEPARTQQDLGASGAKTGPISSAVYMIVALFGLFMAAVAVALYRKI